MAGRTISDTYSAGITLTNTADNPVSVTGKITPTSGIALYGQGGASSSWTVANSGVITAAGGTGVQLGKSAALGGSSVGTAVVTNMTGGTVAGNFGIFVYNSAASPGTLTNQANATISASNYGVFFLNQATVTNSGVIIGAGNYGVLVNGGGILVNDAAGTISGSNGVAISGIATVTNAGTIAGTGGVALRFSSGGGRRLIVDPGAVFVGSVYGGSGTLELASTAGTGTLTATNFTNFNTITFDPSSTWDLVGSSSALAGTITGFTSNETIDLSGFIAVSETYSNGALVLTNTASSNATLHFQGNFTSASFHTQNDGHAGTGITFNVTPQNLTLAATGAVDWNTASNWNPHAVPNNLDNVYITNAGSNLVTTSAAGTIYFNQLTIGGTNTLSVAGTVSGNAIVDNAVLSFTGDETLDETPLSLAGRLAVQGSGTLTLGSNEPISQSGASATIGGLPADNGTIVNQGVINADFAGGSLAIVPLDFSNQGTINATNESLTIGFDDGLIGGVRGTWSNTGTIALAGTASLTLDGLVATGALGTIDGAANKVTVTGTLDNSGTMLAVGSGTPFGTVGLQHTGVVSGGTIVDTAGNGFIFTSGVFSGVTYQGALNITTNASSAGGRLIIENGLTATDASGSGPGTINLDFGDDSIIDFQGSQTIDNATINLNGTYSFSPLSEIDSGGNASVLTLGPNLTVNSTTAGTQADIRGNSSDQTAVINQGTIIAGAAGGNFNITLFNGFTNQGTIAVSNGDFVSIQPGSGIFTNSGIVSVAGNSTLQISDNSVNPPINNTGTITLGSASTLDLAGPYTIPSLGNLSNSGTTQIDGTFDGLNGTIALGSGTPLHIVRLDGQIRNATIVANGALSIIPGNASLQNDVYEGPVNLTSDFTGLTVFQGVSFADASGNLPGIINVSGQQDNVTFANSFPANASDGQTFDHVTLNIGNATAADSIQAGFNGGTFTIGPNATIVSSTTGAMASLSALTATVLNLDGRLDAIASGGTFTLAGLFSFIPSSSSTVHNDGTIVIGNHDTLKLTTAIAADGNTGTIDLGSSGTLDVGGSFGIVASVAATQTLAFTDATGVLKLRQPTSFTAAISGFTVGDAIDLPGIAATKAVWTAGAPGQLAITNSGSAVTTLTLLGDYSAIPFTVGTDDAGGSIITATCYAAGTRIRTTRGEIAVEHLREGDLALTISGRAQPIRWIGRRRVDFRRHPKPERVRPIRIAPHAFGAGLPKRPLLLSPDHAVFVDDVLIPIRHLINGTTVAQIERTAITYYHIELPRHDVLLAEGMPAESYLESGARDAFANSAGAIQLHPDFAPPQDRYATLWEREGYAPLVIAGEPLDRIRQRLACQASLLPLGTSNLASPSPHGARLTA
jgi:hypothetical protein